MRDEVIKTMTTTTTTRYYANGDIVTETVSNEVYSKSIMSDILTRRRNRQNEYYTNRYSSHSSLDSIREAYDEYVKSLNY